MGYQTDPLPYMDNGPVQLYEGDARDIPLPDASVQTVVTSPPYWGLRAYGGDAGMIGLEPTFAEHLANIIAVFREVRRVLRDDGTLWLNYGDAYSNAQPRGSFGDQGDLSTGAHGELVPKRDAGGLRPKNLLGMPWRVAFALQDDGWVLRSDIIWAKPNPMPESVTDRPTRSHEYLFLFSKTSDPTHWTHPGRPRRTLPPRAQLRVHERIDGRIDARAACQLARSRRLEAPQSVAGP